MTEIARWQIDALLISPCALQRFMQIQNDDGEMTVSPVSETSEPSTPSTPSKLPLRATTHRSLLLEFNRVASHDEAASASASAAAATSAFMCATAMRSSIRAACAEDI